MQRYSFEELKFFEHGGVIRVFFLGNYYFDIDKEELGRYGDFGVENGELLFSGKERKIEHLINNGFEGLYNSFTGRRTVYCHQNSGIPLIGSSYLGIVDRNTNLVELRPNTGCNLNCIYCSVNEGGKKAVDFVVEAEYLLQELEELIRFKDDDDIEVHINPQGEPLLYRPIEKLVQGIRKLGVKRISVDTNGVALTKNKADRLIEAGLTQFNVSVDSLDEKNASKISGCSYPAEKIKETLGYIAGRCGLILTPLLMPGKNEEDVEDVVRFAKELGVRAGVQNFLWYKHGKNPVKGISMDEFYKKLKFWENKHNMKLVYTEKDFGIHKTRRLPTPFKKDEVVDCHVVAPGRMDGEVLAKARGRLIEVKEAKEKKRIKAKILRTKHNIFRANQVG